MPNHPEQEQEKRTWRMAGSVIASLCQEDVEADTKEEAIEEYRRGMSEDGPYVDHYAWEDIEIDYIEEV